MQKKRDPVSAGMLESSLSGLGGVLLVAAGLRRRGFVGVFQAAVGGCLLWRSVTACSELSGFLAKESTPRGGGRRRPTSRPVPGRPRFEADRAREPGEASRKDEDAVTESSQESFPASDAPSWAPGHA